MPTILIFLKAPRRNYVKTRLAHAVGAADALHAYRALVMRQLTALPKKSPLEIHYTPRDAQAEMQTWLGQNNKYYPQFEGALGERLEQAVAAAFQRGAKSVVCIGGDCPQLNASHIEEAERQLLAGEDVVFGPSEDGGYYLIAMKTPLLELFREIPWSTAHTLQASLDKAQALQLKVARLETLYDVDQIQELERALADKLIQV
ncbi:TIGR04282 family arsenosugar biosynthesis glycosyltransferase [Coraliomargarita sp. SDUM461004]|uniref:TIGR04282 family arsenosugar biosynthesis glycosyltransferase n=1 Tax=Thalassobacterium sedimentorum TaxID=3041258 RepID=A0ABU1AMT7_9BACT|nr:TIGR04282 family arsenosugar biosynthesis glycosyltransferase [Coraliomargarita sp. SDUM461004]MDQ8195081.1 TIGR04282 family arsenosugar biosynthesis glycosyltransferase [Coraliomargarita sp. SDUM461004]